MDDSIFLKSLFTIAAVLASFYLFNNVNAWLGVGLFVATAIFLLYKLYEKMKNSNFLLIFLLALTFASCERVAPNYYGVLMQSYGKNGKSDYTKQQGRVSTMSPGTELFQVPGFEQREDFGDKVLHLKAADNTEFTAKPLYSYKAIPDRVVDLVFQNSRLGSGDDFMKALADNVLEPHIYDLIKEESRKYKTDTLMADGGSLRFEQVVQNIVQKSFEEKGLELITFSANLDFSEKVKAKIDSRNEVNTNVSVIDQQIVEQRKRNELAELKAQENIILSKGITPNLLQQQFIDKWDGKTPLYGNTPLTFMKSAN